MIRRRLAYRQVGLMGALLLVSYALLLARPAAADPLAAPLPRAAEAGRAASCPACACAADLALVLTQGQASARSRSYPRAWLSHAPASSSVNVQVTNQANCPVTLYVWDYTTGTWGGWLSPGTTSPVLPAITLGPYGGADMDVAVQFSPVSGIQYDSVGEIEAGSVIQCVGKSPHCTFRSLPCYKFTAYPRFRSRPSVLPG